MSAPRACRFGAQWLGGGRTRFRLWAPALASLRIEFGDGRSHEMRRPLAGPLEGRFEGMFEGEFDAPPGSAYRFRLPDGRAVPDPASRQQQDDVHGWSLVTGADAYRWRHPDWRGRPWHEAVIYELHVGLAGGFAALAAQLPALAALGITALELMPIADFPGARNWGYDGVLPYAPDRAYGTPEQLKSLIDTAHGLGLMVLLDVVYNHFGPDGNYLHAYAPSFFRADAPTLWGPAIDFRQPAVRAFFADNARYWLEEYRFDGLRFDAVHAIRDPDWLVETAQSLRRALEPARRIHLVLENDDNDERLLGGEAFDAQWNDDAHHALHVLLTGEDEGYYAAYRDAPALQLARCLAEGFAFQGEHSEVHGGARGTPSAQLPPSAFVWFLQNHDQVGNRAFGERLSTLAEPEALRAATALLLLAPMIPLLFMGEEWGAREPFLYFTDHGAELAQAVREGRRREFARFRAFAEEARRAAIPDPNDARTFERSRPRHDAADAAQRHCRDQLRELLRLRHEHVVPGIEGCRSLGATALGETGVLARWRLGNGRELGIASNLGREALPDFVAPKGRLLHASRAAVADARGHLPAQCTLVFLDDPVRGVPHE